MYYVSDGIGPLNSYNYSPVYKLDFGGQAPPPPSSEVLILAFFLTGIQKAYRTSEALMEVSCALCSSFIELL
jgi:hypothetical protein